MPNSSISSRFVFSVLANLLRGGIAFITTVIIARVLGPGEYGDYAFLFGSVVSIMVLLDMGTSQAFQTFMCQKERGNIFVLSYVGWKLLQVLLVLLVVGIILPEEWLIKIWLGHERDLVLLAFAAMFMQQQVWQIMIQIGESKRLTQRVQVLGVSIAAVHFLLVIGFWIGEMLSVRLILGLILVEYLIFSVVACNVLSIFKQEEEPFNGRSVLREYVTYCLPLVFYCIAGFGWTFADRWMLQNFGGSTQQGLYEIGYRFGMISLLFTSSLLHIFWKEIAEATEDGNFELIKRLYRKAHRIVFLASSIIAGFLIPWSKEIIYLMLGPSYGEGAPTLVLMIIYTTFASLMQINGPMLLAASKTKTHVKVGIIVMLVSLPFSYFVLASKDSYLPGLELGSFGLAVKMVLFSIMHVNVISWCISRDYGWKFDWIYQVVVLGGALGFGWLSFELVEILNSFISINLFFKGSLTLLLYCGFAGSMIWWMPWVAGASRQEIKSYIFKFTKLRWT